MVETLPRKGGRVQFIALIHDDEASWQELSDEERSAIYADYMSLSEDAVAAGVMVDGSELAPTSAATTVRVRDAQTLVTDGPYADVKEALGGYFIFECGSIDEAVDWAARIPAAAHGAIEVRPVHLEHEAAA
jgi:hypothetical protein